MVGGKYLEINTTLLGTFSDQNHIDVGYIITTFYRWTTSAKSIQSYKAGVLISQAELVDLFVYIVMLSSICDVDAQNVLHSNDLFHFKT